MLVSGHAEVSVSDGTGGRLVLGKLEEGDVFGEMSLLTSDLHVSDVIAGNRCFVLLIPQAVFSSRIVTHPKAVMYLSRLLAERTRTYAVDITSSQLHANALSKAEDPYCLSLRSDVAGKVLALNAGHSQIRFGIYDTRDARLTVHGIFDGLTGSAVQVSLVAGGTVTVNRREPLPWPTCSRSSSTKSRCWKTAFSSCPRT